MRDENDSGYKLTGEIEEIVDETRLPRAKELAYELSAEWVRANWPGLAGCCARLAARELGHGLWRGLVSLVLTRRRW